MPPLGARIQSQLRQLEQFTVEVIYDRARGRAAVIWGGFLRGLSYLFEAIVSARAYLYQQRLLRPRHLGCLVIVVGNLTVGGTGKTPVVEKLARTLQARGRKVAILSRGYKSRPEPLLSKWWRWFTHQEAAPPRIVSDGQTVLLGSDVAGDEPYMLARNLPGVVVLTDKDRVKAGHFAIKRFGVDTLILDDGFQYFRLADHLQLLLIDKTNPFGNGRLLPRGILREPISHLRRADYVFLTKSDGQRNQDLEATVRAHRPAQDFIECTHRPLHLEPVHRNGHPPPTLPLHALRGKRVLAISGIADPGSFERFLEQLGAEVVARRRFLDHHRFAVTEIDQVVDEAQALQVDLILTTEKDAVRLPPLRDGAPPLLFLRVEIELVAGAKDFDEAVSRICSPRQQVWLTSAAAARRGPILHSAE